MAARYVVEHLNHLGIVAEVCREIGVAAWLDGHNPTSRQQVSVGTATVALVLNGLGWSQPTTLPRPPIFCRQARRILAWTRHPCGSAQRRLSGADTGLVVRSQRHHAFRRPGLAGTAGLWPDHRSAACGY